MRSATYVNPRTGEPVEFEVHRAGFRPKYGRPHFVWFRAVLERLVCAGDVAPLELRLLLYLASRAESSNQIAGTVTLFAMDLGAERASVSRAMSVLVDRCWVRKLGTKSWMLSPHLGWNGAIALWIHESATGGWPVDPRVRVLRRGRPRARRPIEIAVVADDVATDEVDKVEGRRNDA